MLIPWTDARRPVPRLWIRSAEVRGGGGGGEVVRRMGTQQQNMLILHAPFSVIFISFIYLYLFHFITFLCFKTARILTKLYPVGTRRKMMSY